MNIAVAQSGGPTCAINASLLGVLKEALKHPEIEHVYGSVNGIEGIINGLVVDLKEEIKTEEDMKILRATPSTVLGSCRYKLPQYKDKPEVYETITNCFNKYGIKAFFYIGGNDSMDTANKLSKYFKEQNIDIKVIGVPKTVDNDLCETDHTPGFGSAAKYVAATLQEITCDSSVYGVASVTIVEIMGRHAGWLAASTCVLHAIGLSSPHLVYLPESNFTLEGFYNDVEEQLRLHKSVIVCISEGIDLSTFGIDYTSGKVDNFGHKYLSGAGKALENLIGDKFGVKVRSIELNVMQRSGSHIASKTDLDEAEAIGSAAVAAALNGETGKMMAFKRVSNNPYKVEIQPVDANLVANNEKKFPLEWINEKGNNIKDEALDYFLPLIEGENEIVYSKGLPVHLNPFNPQGSLYNK